MSQLAWRIYGKDCFSFLLEISPIFLLFHAAGILGHKTSLDTPYENVLLQGSAKRWALGCVNSPPPAARGSQEAGFTQPRVHLLANPCIVVVYWSNARKTVLETEDGRSWKEGRMEGGFRPRFGP